MSEPTPDEHLIPVGVALDVCGKLIDITMSLHEQYVDLAKVAMPYLPAKAQAALAADVVRRSRELPAAIAEVGAGITARAEVAT